ncbi:MAG: hypothetical protein K2W95_21390 [Candidatus Obscuribacterales bacterium]|nr:hypothetical protein [Candidatus Obscuribacterales bacterium]
MNDINTAPALAEGTRRTDDWRTYPTLVLVGLSLFGLYGVFRVFENNYYEVGNLLSPFYSPKLEFTWWKWSPAILILWIPGLFRATCYYYRKAYYRAFFGTPTACGVKAATPVSPMIGFLTKGGKSDYTGESTGLWSLQNIHRYAFYLATLVLAVLWWDALVTLFAADHFFNFAYLQVSVGTIVFFWNVLLLSAYSFGCHACRHLAGGCLDSFSSSQAAKTSLSIWERITTLNEKHERWAWASLFSVVSADVYTTLVARGFFPDVVLFSMQWIINLGAK